ncbi:MAG: NYN domain-containing protein, partial [Blautia sp.]|nr:NYN domain-containing protein [Blautia sp.]
LERERGITIFSKQAILGDENHEFTLLDTPGHVDFSAEMERTLQVMDYAILVISGTDGIQGHTLTLWKLLKRYQIPVFLFVNKMDQDGTDAGRLMSEIKKRLSDSCVDFSGSLGDEDPESRQENIAMCDEEILEQYLETGEVSVQQIRELIAMRKLFPCYFGSALKMEGVDVFFEGLKRYTKQKSYPSLFGAKVFKIARDDQGNRLTYVKVTGGSLKVKSVLTNKKDGLSMGIRHGQPEEVWEEKADQIRIYSGAKYVLSNEAAAGTVCALTGLTHTYPGQGLGSEAESEMPVLEPVLNYQILLPAECDVHQMLRKLKQLEEEEPQLHIVWDEHLGEIHAMLMGEVQIEILKHLIWERFHVAVEFGKGNIVYKETIAEPVEGVGHFEPLRHYAEVHLLMEPGERGSGMQYFTAVSEDVLDRNWQRLILTHLEEKEHRGVLTGAAITDMQITLIAGKAHLKHTEGGDFRQSTYRAVRQGLKKAKSILLEPYYEFRLEVPSELIGRAMSDIQKMQGTFLPPEMDEDMSVLRGSAPVTDMRDYQNQVIAYTGGRGKLFCELKGYLPCRNQAAVVEEIGYDSERDLENPTGSVFCAHGAGYVVPWDEVEEHMHLEAADLREVFPEDVQESYAGSKEAPTQNTQKGQANHNDVHKRNGRSYQGMGSYAEEKELQAIFERTFGPVKRQGMYSSGKTIYPAREAKNYVPKKTEEEEYLLVDGYNVIFSWPELRELAEADLGAAQGKLMDILSNYQGYKKCTLILVFDAYKLEGHAEEVLQYHNIHVVYTKEAETADQFIERTVHRIGKQYEVSVATSDRLEQIIIMGQGARRLSAADLKEEIEAVNQSIRQDWRSRRQSSRNYLLNHASEELAEYLEEIRLGKK